MRTVEERNLGMILQSQNAGTVLPGDKETAWMSCIHSRIYMLRNTRIRLWSVTV